MQYKLIENKAYSGEFTGSVLSTSIRRLSDNACIPPDPANTDYQQYLAWLDGYEMVNGKLEKTSNSNTPQPAGEPT